MAGKKIEQARKALKSVLNNLRDDDLFNIVVYDDRVESFKPELQRYGPRIRDEAERFVDNIREGGSTNIDSALKTALAMIQDASRPSYVLFLTDGLPTAGETRELAIADNCRQANARRARIFCFGVGYDVNARLLDRLSGGNSGTSEYVKPDEDIETHVGRFYAKMTSPVLADIHLELAGIDINRTYPRDVPDLFEGGQIVWAGRYRQSGRTTIRVSGKVGGERRSTRVPRRACRRLGRVELRLRRAALGRAPARRTDRPDRPARPKQRAGRRAGRALHEIRNPHALHVVPGRRARGAARQGGKRRSQPPGPGCPQPGGRAAWRRSKRSKAGLHQCRASARCQRAE